MMKSLQGRKVHRVKKFEEKKTKKRRERKDKSKVAALIKSWIRH